MEKQEYRKIVRESLKSFWKPGQKLQITGPFDAKGDEGIRCMLCHWPLTGDGSQEQGLKNVYLLTNFNTGHTITVGRVCKEKYMQILADMEKPKKIKGRLVKRKTQELYDEIPDSEERTMGDEEYPYYFGEDDWADLREE
jgi:hypothetical protein